MPEPLSSAKRAYERPLIRSIGEGTMFEDAGRSTNQAASPVSDWTGAGGQGWYWCGTPGTCWPYAAPATSGQETAAGADVGPRTPICSLVDEGERFLLDVELPGADADEIDIFVGRNDVVVTTVSEDIEPGQDAGAGQFYGTLEFNEEIDPEQVAARYANGVLHLTLAKSRSAARRHVKVSLE